MHNQIIVTTQSVSEVVPTISAALQPEEQWVTAGLGQLYNTDSGETVNAQTSLTYSSVWQAVCLISQSVAGLPLEIYQRTEDDDREKMRFHPAYPLLNVSPSSNADITAQTWKETIQAHALTWGNGYAEIERNNAGRPVALNILHPSNTYPDTDESGMLFYWTNTNRRDELRQIMPRNMFHLKGLSDDGLAGYSVFKMARNSWGLGLAQEKHGNRHFKNNARPNIALKTGAHLNEDQATALRQRFETRLRGLNAETSTAVLSGGLEIVPFSISNEDSQWLQSRQFQRQEVASWFNVPPHMLGDSSTTGYNSIAEENRRFLQQTLMPWLRKWSSEADLKLLENSERRGKQTYFEHSTASLIETDLDQTVNQITALIASEVMSVNEARRKLNMNRRADGRGDEFRNPNISSGEAQPAPEVENAAQPVADPEPFAKLLADRLRHLQDVEAKQVYAASKRRKVSFPKWCDTWYADWQERTRESLEPIAEVWRAVGLDFNPAAVAACYIDNNKSRVLALFEERPRGAFPGDIEGLYLGELDKWPQELAALAKKGSENVQNPKL